LKAITAAVVGVILNLAVWFALHVFFAKVILIAWGPLTLWRPEVSTLDWRVVILAGLSAFLLLRRHWGIPSVLAGSAALALAMRYLLS
jgi:chromate transporter